MYIVVLTWSTIKKNQSGLEIVARQFSIIFRFYKTVVNKLRFVTLWQTKQMQVKTN
jgi:hypothetical protein